MKAHKKYNGGGITDDRSVNRRESDRLKKQQQVKTLEAAIEKAKGTPEAKALVQQHRALISSFANGGKIEKKDKRSKRSTTAINKARLRAASRNLKRKTDKYGSLSEAAEKGSKAVRKVAAAEDRKKRVAALAGRDPQESKQPQSRRPKAKSPSVKTKRPKAPKVKFAGSSRPGKGGKQFNEARMKGRLRASKKAGCYGRNCD